MSTSVSTRSPGALNPTRQQLDELDALLKRMLELPVNQLDNSEDADDFASPPPSSSIPSPNGGGLRGPSMERRPAAPPVSYMVVETASPRPLPTASGFEPRPSVLTPRPAPVTPERDDSFEEEPPMPAAPPVQRPAEIPAVESPSNEAEVWVPLRSTWQPSAQTWQPLAESWQQANGATPPTVPMPLSSPRLAVPPPTPDPIESVHRLSSMVGPAPRMSQGMTGATPVPAVPAPVEPRLSLSAEDAPVSPPRLLLPLVWFNQGFDACLDPLGDPGRWLSGPKGRQTLGVVGLLCLAAATVIVISAGLGWPW